jgi:hypothetical protein
LHGYGNLFGMQIAGGSGIVGRVGASIGGSGRFRVFTRRERSTVVVEGASQRASERW